MTEIGHEQETERLRYELNSQVPKLVWACELLADQRSIQINGVCRENPGKLSYSLLVDINIVRLAGAQEVARSVCNELAQDEAKDIKPTKMESSEAFG
jgi:hypothetical protein